MWRSPSGQTRPHAVPTPKGQQGLERMAGTGASASGAGTGSARSAARFRSARRSTPAGRGHQLHERIPWDHGLEGSACLIRGPGLQGQVTTATPVRSNGAGHQEGHREPAVDTTRDRIRNSGNRLATTNRRDFRGLQRALHARMRSLHARNHGERVVRLGLTRAGLALKALREIQRPVFSLLEGCALQDLCTYPMTAFARSASSSTWITSPKVCSQSTRSGRRRHRRPPETRPGPAADDIGC
jgi:hypothetical protein